MKLQLVDELNRTRITFSFNPDAPKDHPVLITFYTEADKEGEELVLPPHVAVDLSHQIIKALT